MARELNASVLIALLVLFHRDGILCETRCVHRSLTLVGQAGVLATVLPSAGLHRCIGALPALEWTERRRCPPSFSS